MVDQEDSRKLEFLANAAREIVFLPEMAAAGIEPDAFYLIPTADAIDQAASRFTDAHADAKEKYYWSGSDKGEGRRKLAVIETVKSVTFEDFAILTAAGKLPENLFKPDELRVALWLGAQEVRASIDCEFFAPNAGDGEDLISKRFTTRASKFSEREWTPKDIHTVDLHLLRFMNSIHTLPKPGNRPQERR